MGGTCHGVMRLEQGFHRKNVNEWTAGMFLLYDVPCKQALGNQDYDNEAEKLKPLFFTVSVLIFCSNLIIYDEVRGRVDGWVDSWMGLFIDGCTNVLMVGYVDEQTVD